MISVILCTHNPRQDFLRRTLEHLQRQTLPRDQWELLLVDNASATDLALLVDLSWHPRGRHLKEPVLGLTPARLAGIAAAQYELLVFVDDDNLLDAGYLEQAGRIAGRRPYIGAFGGNITGDFEQPPPGWLMPHLSVLAVRDLERSLWSNLYDWQTAPLGAGLVIRAEIARQYAGNTSQNALKSLLGRKGKNTVSGEDLDMVYTALDMGYGAGRFTDLALTHLIPKERLNRRYLLRLFEGIAFSDVLLHAERPAHAAAPPGELARKIVTILYRVWPFNYMEILIQLANVRGILRAKKFLRAYRAGRLTGY